MLRDQKVLPEVRNRSLFSKGFGQLFGLRNSSFIQSVNLQFHSLKSDIPISLSCSLKSSSSRRLVNSESHLDTRFEIYGSTIGVRNLVCYEPFCQQFNAAIQQKSPPPTSLSSFSLVLSVNFLFEWWGVTASKHKAERWCLPPKAVSRIVAQEHLVISCACCACVAGMYS